MPDELERAPKFGSADRPLTTLHDIDLGQIAVKISSEYNQRTALGKGILTMSTSAVSPVGTVTWKIDPAHSQAEFKVKHMMISNLKGTFSRLNGTLIEDTTDPTRSQVEATIEIGSISTGDDARDTHLKSADFFHHDQHPVMTFKSTRVEKKGAEEYTVTGDLTLHGETKPVTFAVEGPSAPGKDPWGNTRIGLSATTKINRKDFGLTWNAALETGGILVGEDVQITLDVQFIKA
jgi:polyisoprenoid-binding protein YceI